MTQSKATEDLVSDSVATAFIRLDTRDLSIADEAELKTSPASELLDPTYRAFFSYLDYRRQALASKSAEAKEAEAPVLDALQGELMAAARAQLPKGVEPSFEPLPELSSILVQRTTKSPLQVVAELNKVAFAQPPPAARHIDVAALQKEAAQAESAQQVEVEVLEADDGSRSLTYLEEDFDEEEEEAEAQQKA